MTKILIGLIQTKGKTKEQLIKEIHDKLILEKANHVLKLNKDNKDKESKSSEPKK